MEDTSAVLLYTGLAIVAALVLLGLVVVVLQWVRRMQLRRTFGTFEGFVAKVDPSTPAAAPAWVAAIFRYQQDQVEMLKLRSISPIPMYRFRRSDMEIARLTDPEAHVLQGLPEKYVVVKATHGAQEFLFAMSFDAYAGLSAWWEARQIMGFGQW